jgi:lysophospholipase L1-like esterase
MSRLTSSLTLFLSVAAIAASDASFAQTPAVQMSAAMPAAVAGPAPAAASAAPSAPGAAQAANCTAPSLANRLDQPLRRLAKRMAAGQPVTIVAIGSSSTAGAGASSSAASYPSRLEVELKERFPHLSIRVLNRGVNGEEAPDMLARFDKAVLSEQPDLVLWQVGTNAVLRHHRLGPVATLIHEGLARLKETGADVILMDPQFAPRVVAEPEAERMVDLIQNAAKAENISVFHRFDLMRHWRDSDRISFETFVSPDGLHMNDWGYACVAKLLAGAIYDATTRATAVAGGAPHS